MEENAKLSEMSKVEASTPGHDALVWHAKWKVEKFLGDWSGPELEAGLAGKPYEVIEREGNLLMYGGASCLWETLIGNGTASAGQSLTYFNNSQAAIGVGDSTNAAAATQNDMQAASNKVRVAMDATYPTHTDGTASGNASIVFKSTYTSAVANWAWQEWGVFNSASAGTGRMLNRKVESLGTKGAGSTWALTVTLTLA